MNSGCGTTCLPRYWITFRGEIIFDYPKQFLVQEAGGDWKFSENV